MRTVAVVTTSRADYGIYRPVLRQLQGEPDLGLRLMVSGSHLSPDLGMTVKEIEGDGFPISDRIEVLLSSDSPEGTAKSMALGIAGFGQCYARKRPDLLVVLGDRFEMHAAALAALPFRIPLAHIHGGEVTTGAMDEALRHSMTKLSHLHFVAREEHARRVIQLGEEAWRVTVCGAPSLDNLATLPRREASDVEREFGLSPGERFLLVTFHPATLEPGEPGEQAEILSAAVERTGLRAVWSLPNADPGGRAVRTVMERRARQNMRIRLVENLGTPTHFGLMGLAAAMVGNSSSGIIEAASFGLPVVNVGERQAGRPGGANIINVAWDVGALDAALERALAREFRQTLKGMANPYGDGHAAQRIVARLKSVDLGPSLILKRFKDLGAGSR